MAKDKNTLISEIEAHLASCGGTYPQWYVGIAADVRDRLFNGHAVKQEGDAWIYRQCDTSAVARAIEDHFVSLGLKGGPGGGDSSTRFVYAYKIAAHTVE